MGAGNVKAVFGAWSHLPDQPFRVLVYMAVISLDKDDPPRFWGTRHSIAVALGRTWNEDGDKDHRAALQAAKRAISVLVDECAIVPLRHAAPGRNQAYLINVTGVTHRTPNGGHSPYPVSGNGGHSPYPERGSLTVPQRSKREEELDLGITDTGPNPSTSPTTRPRR